MWGLFNSKLDNDDSDNHCILDGYDKYPIDSEYMNMGIREKWLECTGYYRDATGCLWWTYVLK
jgi:hypothetical protein